MVDDSPLTAQGATPEHAAPVEAAGPTRPLEELEALLGHIFADRDYLVRALVHKSYLHDVPDFYTGSNERLEFLGDSVLALIVSGELYLGYPEVSEGELTALRGALVRKSTLATLAEPLELGRFLYLSKGEEAAGGRLRGSNIANLVEALLGAVYLDAGFSAATRVWHLIRGDQRDEALREVLKGDYKSQLQHFTQAHLKLTPAYRLVGTSGPEHSKVFQVAVLVGERVLAEGEGSSKQLAQQQAAKNALGILEAEIEAGREA